MKEQKIKKDFLEKKIRDIDSINFKAVSSVENRAFHAKQNEFIKVVKTDIPEDKIEFIKGLLCKVLATEIHIPDVSDIISTYVDFLINNPIYIYFGKINMSNSKPRDKAWVLKKEGIFMSRILGIKIGKHEIFLSSSDVNDSSREIIINHQVSNFFNQIICDVFIMNDGTDEHENIYKNIFINGFIGGNIFSDILSIYGTERSVVFDYIRDILKNDQQNFTYYVNYYVSVSNEHITKHEVKKIAELITDLNLSDSKPETIEKILRTIPAINRAHVATLEYIRKTSINPEIIQKALDLCDVCDVLNKLFLLLLN